MKKKRKIKAPEPLFLDEWKLLRVKEGEAMLWETQHGWLVTRLSNPGKARKIANWLNKWASWKEDQMKQEEDEKDLPEPFI